MYFRNLDKNTPPCLSERALLRFKTVETDSVSDKCSVLLSAEQYFHNGTEKSSSGSICIVIPQRSQAQFHEAVKHKFAEQRILLLSKYRLPANMLCAAHWVRMVHGNILLSS